MVKGSFTQYQADDLVQARKLAGRTSPVGNFPEKFLPVYIELHRTDAPSASIGLFLEMRKPRKLLPGVAPTQRPAASLMWHGERIRGIDWNIKHEVTRDGVPTGDVIRGWHEHYWTDADGCKSIREPKPIPKNEDIVALIVWCCKQWNIEGIQEPMRLF